MPGRAEGIIIRGRAGSWLKTLSRFFSLAIAAGVFLVIVSIVTYPSIDQLIKAACSEEILFSIRLSLITTTVSTVICIMVAIPAAYALSRYDIPCKNFVSTMINIPMALPPLVAGVGLLILLGLSPLGQGITRFSGVEFVFAPAGIIVAQCFMNAPYLMRIMRSTFDGVNPRYEHVAKSLGCTDWQAFLRVTMPMAKNGLLAGTVITWSKGIGEFGAVLIIAGATRYRTEILPTSVYLNMSCGELDMAIAAATVMILISVASLYAFEKYGNKANVY